MQKRLLIIVFVLCILIVIFFVFKGFFKTKKPVVPPVNITLNIVAGTQDVPTIFKVRMFSRKSQQELLNNVSVKDKRKSVQTYSVLAKENTWESDLTFYSEDRDGVSKKITKGLKLEKAPRRIEFSLDPMSVYEIVYTLDPEFVPSSGTIIFTKL